MASSDLTVISKSQDLSEPEQNVQQKYFLEIPDSNSQVYNGSQIRISTNLLTSSPDYFSASESEILIPYVHTVTGGGYLAATGTQLMATLKNSVLDVVNSISVKLNGKLVVSPCDMTNTYLNFMLAAQTSKTALPLLEKAMMFSLNNGEILYQGATSTQGVGECHNKTFEKTSANATLAVEVAASLNKVLGIETAVNEGYLRRASVTGFDPAEATETTNSSYISSQNCIDTRTTHFIKNGDDREYHLWIRIPLKQFDFFRKLPIVRGALFDITLQCHSGSITYTTTHANITAGALAKNEMAKPSSVSTLHQFYPFMVGDDSVNIGVGTGAVTIACDIATVSGVDSVFQKKCYLRACMYKLEPSFDLKYASIGNVTFSYDNIRLQPFYSQIPSSVNLLVTNSINKLKGLLVQTCLSRKVNMLALPSTAGGAGISTLESPYTSSLCMKNSGLWTNLNVKIGGIPYFQQNLDYGYQVFYDNIKDLTLNGAITNEIASGLIDAKAFRNGYGFIYIDLSRLKANPAEWMLSKSLEFSGRLNTKASEIDLYCFTIYEDSVGLNVSTSQLVA